MHNHPSGEKSPSECDALLTKQLRSAGAIVGIELLDHIIVARDGAYSFARNGRLT